MCVCVCVLLSLKARRCSNHLIEAKCRGQGDAGGGRGWLQETSSLISVGSPGSKMASPRDLGDGGSVGG